MPHARTAVAALPRLLLVTLLALGVLAMHHLSAPVHTQVASVDAHTALSAAGDGHAAPEGHGHVIPAPAQPGGHDRGGHEDGGHHGWIGLCLAVAGTGLVVLLLAWHLRSGLGIAGRLGSLARHQGRLQRRQFAPPTPSLVALCVMRT